MLTIFDKENRLTVTGQPRTNVKIYRTSQKSIQPISQSQHTAKTPNNDPQNFQNFENFQKQLKRLSDINQRERRQKSQLSQHKNRLQNEIRILQVQKQIKSSQFSKLQQIHNNDLQNIKELQLKNNQILTELYSLKNKCTLLEVENGKQAQCSQQLRSRCLGLEEEKGRILRENVELMGEIGELRNREQVRGLEIQMLRKTIMEMELQSKRVEEGWEADTKNSQQKFDQICNELQNWKRAFERKQQQLQSKTMILKQQNEVMKKTMNNLSQTFMTTSQKFPLSRTCSLPTSQTPQTSNQYHIRLFIKQTQIQKQQKQVNSLQQKIQQLQLQNKILHEKCNEGTILSVMGYRKYTDIHTKILSSNNYGRDNLQLKAELQGKYREIDVLNQRIRELEAWKHGEEIQRRRYQSEVELERIGVDNMVAEMKNVRGRLERQVEMMKGKTASLQKQCQEKDRIIMNYVNKQKLQK